MIEQHKRVVIGVEIESYSIDPSNFGIGRRLTKPRPGTLEKDEANIHDTTIGSEYNSIPYETVREAFFLLRSGLRKYFRKLYRSSSKTHHPAPLLVGSWTDRFAGMHLHISVADRKLHHADALSLSRYLHDHIPFFIAAGANSPVWNRKITARSSNRILYGSHIYFNPIVRTRLQTETDDEIIYNPASRKKPATLELRFSDSNIPHFTVANLCLVKAACLRWLRHRPGANHTSHEDYLTARSNAAHNGMKSQLLWRDEWVRAKQYLDRFLWEPRHELEMMDIPDDIFEVFRVLKLGYNGSRIIHDAAQLAHREHPRTWEKYFAERYYRALEELLSGNSLRDFARVLGVELPETDRAWLGRCNASVDGR